MSGGLPGTPGPEVPVFVISVAAELTGLHPQTLRTYDRLGLVRPGRSGGGGRRYSWRDIELLREVVDLTAAGIGLEGVRRILDLKQQVVALSDRAADLERELEATREALARAGTDPARENPVGRRSNLPAVRPLTGPSQSVVVWRRGRPF